MTSLPGTFAAVDWSFRDAPVDRGVHTIHPYPAKFIPQVPRRLIDLFHPRDGSPVLDPFAGSGTTLVEAIRAGHDAWGVDLSPLACLIARVKTSGLPPGFAEAVDAVIARALDRLAAGGVELPPIPRVDHWFAPHVQKALAALVSSIFEIEDTRVSEALQVALSSIIIKVSRQESDTRYAAVAKPAASEDVLTHFRTAAESVRRSLADFSGNLFAPTGHATVIHANTLLLSARDFPRRFGLVVTSPPYPNAYEYWLYHKYRMYWLRMDPLALKCGEIGARPLYHGSNPEDETDFEVQMRTCFELLSSVMQAGGKACFLVGRSVIRGREIDNAALLERAATAEGFEPYATADRVIPQSRKSFNPSHARITREAVIVFSLVRPK